MQYEGINHRLSRLLTSVGQHTVAGVEEFGYAFRLFTESIYWVFAGHAKKQPVKIASMFKEMMIIGVNAIPIAIVLTFTVGIMLAIQGIHTLKQFGAESQVVLGIALSVTREFAPLIIGILVAGRSGSAVTARIGTMQVSQEIDALRVIGINPVRYLVSPVLIAMLIMLPTLTILANVMGLLGGALLSSLELGMSMSSYFDRSLEVLEPNDILQGLAKSIVFAVIIAIVGCVNGFMVKGGAEGVGRATTRSVVLSISLIVVADMVFTFFLNR